jgi:EmrB/QacA subfamily drug resistance transporter
MHPYLMKQLTEDRHQQLLSLAAGPERHVVSPISSDPGGADVVHKRRWLTLAVLCLSLLIIAVDNTIVNVTLPTLSQALGASSSLLQWIIDSYTLVFAGLLLTAGSLGDRFGRKRLLNLGLIVFGVGSALAARSTSAGELISMRSVMGLGAAMIMPATLSILTQVFRDPAERAKAISLWAAVAGIGVALGPITGGYLLRHFWWGAVFLVNVPLVATALVLGRVLVPASRDPQPRRLDLAGTLLSVAAITSLVWAVIEAPSRGWTSPFILAGFALSFLLFAGFAAWELHTLEPMLPVRFFADRRVTAASLIIGLLFFGLIGTFFLLTQYLQFVHNHDPLQAGVRTLPFAAAFVVSAAMSAPLVRRLGPRAVIAAGMMCVAGGSVLGARLEAGSGDWQLILAIVVQGIGMGLAMAPATESVMGAIPRAHAGVGSAINDTMREIGGALGVAVIGSVAASLYRSRLDSRLRPAHLALGGAAHTVHSSLAGALGVAARSGPAGAAIAHAARLAFTSGVRGGFVLTAGVTLLGAAVALVSLPGRGQCLAAASDGIPDPSATAATAGRSRGSRVVKAA